MNVSQVILRSHNYFWCCFHSLCPCSLRKSKNIHQTYMHVLKIRLCAQNVLTIINLIINMIGVHSRLKYYFWDKGLKDYMALDLGVYLDLLVFHQ